MPLDVQPLSPARRAAMVIVMVALLAASMGFAQLLVQRQQQRATGGGLFPLPPGAMAPMRVNSDLRTMYTQLERGRAGGMRTLFPPSCPVASEAGPRRYTLYAFSNVRGGVPDEELLLRLFATQTASSVLPKLPVIKESTLGGVPALEVEREVSLASLLGDEATEAEKQEMPSAFAIIRMTIVDDRVIAVGFSGAGRPSAADKQSFDDYCKSVHVTD